MSTKLNDVPTQTTFGHSIPADTYTETQVGRTIDLIDADGPCFVVAPVFATTTPDPVELTVQESTDGSTWTDVALDPEIAFEAPQDAVFTGRFTRTKRYARAVLTAAEATDLRAAVLIGQQKKTV